MDLTQTPISATLIPLPWQSRQILHLKGGENVKLYTFDGELTDGILVTPDGHNPWGVPVVFKGKEGELAYRFLGLSQQTPPLVHDRRAMRASWDTYWPTQEGPEPTGHLILTRSENDAKGSALVTFSGTWRTMELDGAARGLCGIARELNPSQLSPLPEPLHRLLPTCRLVEISIASRITVYPNNDRSKRGKRRAWVFINSLGDGLTAMPLPKFKEEQKFGTYPDLASSGLDVPL